MATGQSTSENRQTDLIKWLLEVTLYLIICSFEEWHDNAVESMFYYTSFLIMQDCSDLTRVCSVNVSIQSPSTEASSIPHVSCVCVMLM